MRDVEETAEPLWTCDEMLGRLARYLRFLGYDTLYARGMTDTEILRQAREQDRRVLTRDKGMAQRSRRAVLIQGLEVDQQLKELRAAYPRLRTTVSFIRCSLCNALLREADRSAPTPPRSVPELVWASSAPVYLCAACGQAYWEGSHTDEIRRTLARVFADPPPTGGPR